MAFPWPFAVLFAGGSRSTDSSLNSPTKKGSTAKAHFTISIRGTNVSINRCPLKINCASEGVTSKACRQWNEFFFYLGFLDFAVKLCFYPPILGVPFHVLWDRVANVSELRTQSWISRISNATLFTTQERCSLLTLYLANVNATLVIFLLIIII